MIQLNTEQCRAVHHWFQPEAPGIALAAAHVLATGHGTWSADRWPDPRLLLAAAGPNLVLRGDATVFAGAAPPGLTGFVDAGPRFLPVLEQVYAEVEIWPRVLYRLDRLAMPPATPEAVIRPLMAADALALARLGPDTVWIANTWGGPDGLAASGFAWGAFVDGALTSVACTFFVGSEYEEIGVATVSAHRGRGYSTACAAALCRDILGRGTTPAWSTSPDNLSSIRVAQKLGFAFIGEDVTYIVNRAIPEGA